MYDKYLHFISNKINHNIAIEELKIYGLNITSSNIRRVILRNFVSKYSSNTFEINDGILYDFPLIEKIRIIELWVDNEYYYGFGSMIYEITKMIYKLWPEYMNKKYNHSNNIYLHDKMFNNLCKIKNNLNEFEYIKNNEELYKIGFTKKKARYMYWHLFGLFPLLKNGIELFLQVSKLNYDDAQDCLMFSIPHFPINIFIPLFKETLKYWQDNNNISFDNGTGMIGQLEEVVKVFKNKNYNILEDEDFVTILQNNVTNEDMKRFYKIYYE